jgi:sugar/nucleoside kinase (ribokinase family)
MYVSDNHIIGIGNALVDVLAPVPPATIDRHGLTLAAMHLIDSEAADLLYAEVEPEVQQSGGSVANTIAHIGETGHACTFIGKVADDKLGETFRADMKRLGIEIPAPALSNGTGTGRCIVLVTPDGERTMSTYLGAAQELGPEDIEASMPDHASIVLIEGYLWDSPRGNAVIDTAAECARRARARIALTPSDAACVARNRDAIIRFVREHCDILIGNEDELAALSGAATAEDSLSWAREHVSTAALTMSENGSLVCSDECTARIGVKAVDAVVDVTGAGDAYAAGFLHALSSGAEVPEAGIRGTEAASKVITHYGARRPQFEPHRTQARSI